MIEIRTGDCILLGADVSARKRFSCNDKMRENLHFAMSKNLYEVLK